MWCMHIPFIPSILIWRALNEKLSIYEKLTTFGIDLTNCFWCTNSSRPDTMNHSFNNGDLAVEILKSIANIEGVKSYQSSLK